MEKKEGKVSAVIFRLCSLPFLRPGKAHKGRPLWRKSWREPAGLSAVPTLMRAMILPNFCRRLLPCRHFATGHL